MSQGVDRQATLAGGQIVGWAEYGDPGGRPLFHLHGLPSSRFETSHPAIVAAAERLGVRLIVPDRPGVGLSSFFPYTISDYPDLLSCLADHLQIERFGVSGFSSGGKYVAACAWKIPHRLDTAIIISGTAPLALPKVRATLGSQDRFLNGCAARAPWLLRLLLAKVARDVRRDPAAVLSLFAHVADVDRMALSEAAALATLGRMVNGAFCQGTAGVAHDWRLEAREWGVPLAEIAIPIDVVHGEEDRIVNPDQARILAAAIPTSRLHLFPGEGHSLWMRRFPELLARVLP